MATSSSKMITFMLYLPQINSMATYNNPQLNMTFHYSHRKLLPFVPDPGGNKTCLGQGDPVCGQHGTCVANWVSPTNWTCKCDTKWFTREVDAITGVMCSTQRPSQAIALFLQIFLGWISVGALYLGWTIYGTIQFMVIASVCVLSCCSAKQCKTKEISTRAANYQVNDNISSLLTSCYGCFIVLIISVMWIYNLALILNNCYNAEGVPCVPM